MPRFVTRLRPTSLVHALAAWGGAALGAWLGARPLWHDDLFLHLRTGEIVARTGAVPTVDVFTHTVAGTPWTSHEWGFGLWLHAGHALGGTRALLFYLPVLVVLVLLVTYGQMCRHVAPDRRAAIVPVLLVGVGAALVSCFVLRAALVTTLGLALVGEILQRFRARPSRAQVAALGAVMLVWANMHAGVVFGLVTIGLYWLQAAFDLRPAGATGFARTLLRGEPRRHVALLVGSALITLLNPSGIDLWTFAFRVNDLFYRSDIVWSMGQYRAPRIWLYPWFFLLVVLALAACLPLRRFREAVRERRAPLLAQGLGAAFFLALALRSNRFIFDFVVFAAPFCAMLRGGRALALDHERALPIRLVPWLDLAAVALVAATAFVVRPRLPPRDLDPTVQKCLADFMEREGVRGTMFNYERSGGYLGWRLRQPVYWDGRNDIFGPLAIELAYAENLDALVERHGLDMLVLDRTYRERFADTLRPGGVFALVYFDDHSALYVKRIERFAALRTRSEYRLLQPFGVPSPDALRSLTPELRAHLAREVDRAIADCPDNAFPRMLKTKIAPTGG